MAVIDIDIHIITDVVDLHKKLDLLYIDFEDNGKKIINITIKEGVLARSEIQNGEFQKLRAVKNKLIKNSEAIWQKIIRVSSEIRGLLGHTINRIEKADTGKGKEHIRIDE